jgi:hypothetical protein
MSEERSILTFQGGDLNTVIKLMKGTSKEWKKRGYETFIRNTPSGGYEIYGIPDKSTPTKGDDQ